MTSNYVNLSGRPIKFHEGWLEHKSQTGSWTRYWCVLKNNIIYIFANERTSSKESHFGTIALGPDSSLKKLDGDEKTGYKFDIFTAKRYNRFKAAKFSERELWRACVEGIATGEVPDSIDLLPGQIEDVRLLLRQLFGDGQHLGRKHLPVTQNSRNDSSSPLIKDGFDSPNSSSSGSFSELAENIREDYLEPQSSRTNLRKPEGPVFYKDSSRTDIPSWFFAACSREMAIKILTEGRQYGNTLMRESTHSPNSFVISRKMDQSGDNVFSHYILEHTPMGYKLDVENPHEPMNSLSEVMEFYVKTSGVSTTRPMTCNNLKQLGIVEAAYDYYSKKIMRVSVIHDAESGEENIRQAQSTRMPNDRVINSAKKIAFDVDEPPEPPAPPPPSHHVKIQQHKTMVSPELSKGWNKRSYSVPNIIPVCGLSARQDKTGYYVNDATPFDQTVSSDSPPPLPPNHPTSSGAPPLPPNHPSKGRKHSIGSMDNHIRATQENTAQAPGKLGNKTSNTLPKHSQSMSSADNIRKLSPLPSQTTNFLSELSAVTARIQKHRLCSETDPEPNDPPPEKSPSGESVRSQTVVSESFKNKLEGLILKPVVLHGQDSKVGGSSASDSTVSSPPGNSNDVYEDIEHYQNSFAIKHSK